MTLSNGGSGSHTEEVNRSVDTSGLYSSLGRDSSLFSVLPEMERWSGKVAIVTGASAGIGAAISQSLVKHGLQVVGIARRSRRLEEFSAELSTAPGKLHPLKCDITKENDIISSFAWVKENLGGVDILINNAGVFNEILLHDFRTEEWLQMLNVNIVGLTLCTREAVRSMRERGVNEGHIVYISSFLGRTISNNPGFNMYAATKHTVTTLAESLRRELVQLEAQIKVSNISPGIVRTEMLSSGITRTIGPDIYDKVACLDPKDVSDAVIYVLGTPPHIQIQELTLLAVGQES
ncbi:farnesol dehydrogenase isoform X1 [Cryptotermes secundus]|uniref:farnesol dehydrogenase isoform X1 n=2 Tax=Cryptotermes secundus TaxID=105785 RepID=UPI000CD7D1B8|nr:farnesol dehydrogenase isoform X1 [Cryptotermes secundus]XP_023719732.1 farnesol dehydrogenase isoform X1 [Cryptotermes secundus]XP_023719733.1 farnesol dehydrogenase isoform X1 [Cryptotermes secundus]XP_023719734.1 farnesol dehydrogenase isoform X1 [Cryptotermes secundus]XP_023719735.1 farnesol dehydrogenase isoform X1 [Cryptotermes secundus]